MALGRKEEQIHGFSSVVVNDGIVKFQPHNVAVGIRRSSARREWWRTWPSIVQLVSGSSPTSTGWSVDL